MHWFKLLSLHVFGWSIVFSFQPQRLRQSLWFVIFDPFSPSFTVDCCYYYIVPTSHSHTPTPILIDCCVVCVVYVACIGPSLTPNRGDNPARAIVGAFVANLGDWRCLWPICWPLAKSTLPIAPLVAEDLVLIGRLFGGWRLCSGWWTLVEVSVSNCRRLPVSRRSFYLPLLLFTNVPCSKSNEILRRIRKVTEVCWNCGGTAFLGSDFSWLWSEQQ